VSDVCYHRAASAATLAIVAGLAVAACSSSSGPSRAVRTPASVPFPVAVGNTWKYKLTGGESGTVTEKMTSVVPSAGGRKAVMTFTSTIARASASTESVYFFYSDGSITSFPSPQSGQRNLVTISSSGIRVPPAAVVDSGKPVKLEVPTTVNGGERTYKTMAHITVQGAGTATVTVPAGTYRATVVSEVVMMSLFGHPVTFHYRTWFASGVGPVQVRDASTNTAGKDYFAVTLELESFSKAPSV
jgi:hypothetical protein